MRKIFEKDRAFRLVLFFVLKERGRKKGRNLHFLNFLLI